MSSHAIETGKRERFQFGNNWQRFLTALTEERISAAENALREMLLVHDLQGIRFLDIGSGSGLSSLAARQLGARVHSFDYDPQSVACTAELKHRYMPDDPNWTIEEGSALDTAYLTSLGRFDVVYSWGVLHHTGHMWRSLENVTQLVAPGGKLFVAIYNDMGNQSKRWRWIKRTYNKLPNFLKPPFTITVMTPRVIKSFLGALASGQLREVVRAWTRPRRGMSRWHDMVDWVGGYPYEVAKPEEILDFYRARGFELVKLTCGGVGLGCNEYVFIRSLDKCGT